jgi:hypothetical protein
MKHCNKCGETKHETEFPFNGGRLRSQCKACVAEKSRQWRIENPTHATKYMREYWKKNRAQLKERMDAKRKEIAEWKRARGCTVCGETEPWVLDMHHLDPSEKEANPAASATLKTFLKEADKCVLLCSNCHRKVHAGVLKITKKVTANFKRSLKNGSNA